MVSIGFGSVVGPFLFVVDLSGVEVCLEVWPGLVGRKFVIPFFDCVGKNVLFCGDYFSNADYLLVCFRVSVGFGHSGVGVDDVEYVCDEVIVDVLMRLSCIFWPNILPYESKRYFMRSMMVQSRTPVSLFILVTWTYLSRDAWNLLVMVRLI